MKIVNWVMCGLLFSSVACASSIRLLVKDPSGSALAATGRLLSTTSGVVSAFQVASDGAKILDGLPAGRYRIEVNTKGFNPTAIGVDLAEGVEVSREIVMSVGPASYQVEVMSVAPLPGLDRSLNEMPATLQVATSGDIDKSGAINLPDFLNRRLNGVYLNEVQGNPFQMDLNYRGFTASPLLGTPQGVSLYLDGVRVNNPFGDVVSWDLIPRNIIAELTLVPGSNPLFGLNTLGGAVAVETKDGRRHPGTSIQFGGGSFGRKTADLEHGGTNGKGLDWFLSSSLFFEDGWRESSPSNVRQFFGKLGWQGGKTSLGLTVMYANNALIGNGLQEERFLARDYRSVYTKPDLNHQRSPFLNLRGRRALSGRWSVAGNAYYRFIDASTLNGDINEASLDQSLYTLSAADQAALRAAGYSGFPTSGANAANTPFPFWRCIAQVLQRDEPAEKCNGLLNRSKTDQHNYGVAGQASWDGVIGSVRHQVAIGGAFDGNRVGFVQSTQLGYLNPDRSVTGLAAFGDGVTGGEIDGEPYDTRVNLKSRIDTASIYGTDTLKLGSRWNLTVSGRYNRTAVVNRDQILPGGGTGSLNGDYVFQRFNPAVGLTRQMGAGMNVYFGYAEGSRAPTAIELGCADPAAPCRLPNAMAGDPPLRQVVTRTVEFGLRGSVEGNWRWNAGYFRAENRDDLLFVASKQTGFGYFKNFGKTRRQGLEAALNGRLGRMALGASHTWLEATFESPEEVNGAGNSSNELARSGRPGFEGTIRIDPGSRIPMTPRHMGKAYADLQVTRLFTVDLGLSAISSSIARGNENNQHRADGRYYLGEGYAAGYAVTNLGARYQVTSRIQIYAQMNNVLNRRYYSAAQLGATGFTRDGNFVARPFPGVNGAFPIQSGTFFAPGAPRGLWGGIRYQF